MASLSTLRINSYFFMSMMGLIFGLFIVGVLLLLGVPWPFNIYIAISKKGIHTAQDKAVTFR